MNIIIHNAEVAELTHLAACVQRIQQWIGTGPDACFYPDCLIFCRERDSKGFLEYGIKINYRQGGYIFIGAIQREPGAPVEFHS